METGIYRDIQCLRFVSDAGLRVQDFRIMTLACGTCACRQSRV